MKLSLREQEILAGIENDLQTQDPELAETLRDAPMAPVGRRRRRLSTGQQAVLMLAPHLVIVAFAVAFYLGIGGLAMVGGVLVLLRLSCVACANAAREVRALRQPARRVSDRPSVRRDRPRR